MNTTEFTRKTIPDNIKKIVVIILSILPLLAVIAFVLWRILKSKGINNTEICNLIFKVHISVFLFVVVLSLIIGFVATSDDNSHSSDNMDAWICAKEVVKEHLKLPSTADFCKYTEASITHLGKNRYEISGYVDAENSFGASVRNSFTVTLTLMTDGYKDSECYIQ